LDAQISKSTKSVFIWMICFVCLLLCCVAFWALGQATSLPDVAALAYPVVSFVALAIIWLLLSTPLTFASINPDGEVTFKWRYLTRSERKVFHVSSLAEPTTEERVDSDGDSFWSVKLVLPDSSVFVICEYGALTGSGKNEKTKQRCEAKRAEFVEKLSRHGSMP
jgi:hypothetical protein